MELGMTDNKELYDSVLLSLYEANPNAKSMNTFDLTHFKQRWSKDWMHILDQLVQDNLLFLHRYEGTTTYKLTPKGVEYAKTLIKLN